ncbi:MAG: NAD-dependent epimerase/dehydratase family protein [Myxococcota bacterium]|nr:NAD-dependent epimerase/dehydratase family protein [Myxococcota bacterium]
MKVFITGASGFLGSAVVRSLLRDNHEVIAIVRPTSQRKHLDQLGVEVITGELTDTASLHRSMNGCEGLCHIAGAAGSFYLDEDNYYQANVVTTSHVFAAAKQAGIRRSVYCGSVVVPQRLDSPYGLSKRLGMQVAMASADENFVVTAVHPSGMIGPEDRKPTPLGQAVIQLADGNMPITIGGGSGYIDVDDAADMHVAAMVRGDNLGEYIANAEYFDNRVLYRELAKFTSQRAPFVLPIEIAQLYAAFDEPRARKEERSPVVSKFTTSYLAQGKAKDLDGKADRKRLNLPPAKPVLESFADALEWFETNNMLGKEEDFGPSRA